MRMILHFLGKSIHWEWKMNCIHVCSKQSSNPITFLIDSINSSRKRRASHEELNIKRRPSSEETGKRIIA